RRYIATLGAVFAGLCAYCEEICRGEIDHFRPKSRYPERVYEWSKWVLACHDCNNKKGEKWPSSGFPDPCSTRHRCEKIFSFDTQTGEILPSRHLAPAHERRARLIIRDCGLNEYHHLRKRLQWMDAVALA